MVKDLMEINFVTLKSHDSINKALEVMNNNKVNGAPVVDSNNKLLGMIVKADIYRFLMEEGHYDTCPVEWVMTKSVIIGHKYEELIDIAKRIREKNIIAIPIVDDNNKVDGIVTIEDIVDYFIKKY
ncbi:CBS domain-containing protein [Clostridium rectalis]|uniref:CBS domain-containing protein n=1 Tax=Clostridium rectalis TaxID=2040295 RepID=UPI000F6382E9|nr:CBS domain-containing protein [Clostridium rectalis]